MWQDKRPATFDRLRMAVEACSLQCGLSSRPKRRDLTGLIWRPREIPDLAARVGISALTNDSRRTGALRPGAASGAPTRIELARSRLTPFDRLRIGAAEALAPTIHLGTTEHAHLNTSLLI